MLSWTEKASGSIWWQSGPSFPLAPMESEQPFSFLFHWKMWAGAAECYRGALPWETGWSAEWESVGWAGREGAKQRQEGGRRNNTEVAFQIDLPRSWWLRQFLCSESIYSSKVLCSLFQDVNWTKWLAYSPWLTLTTSNQDFLEIVSVFYSKILYWLTHSQQCSLVVIKMSALPVP